MGVTGVTGGRLGLGILATLSRAPPPRFNEERMSEIQAAEKRFEELRARQLPPGVYNVENTAGIGEPVRVFDAEGKEYFKCLEVDTVTGRMAVCEFDIHGHTIFLDNGQLKTQTVTVPAPLVVVKKHAHL